MLLVYLLLGVLVIVTVPLFVPLSFAVQGTAAAEVFGRIRLSWAGGMITGVWHKQAARRVEFNLYLAGRPRKMAGKSSAPQVPAAPSRSRSQRGGWEEAKLWLDRDVIRELIRVTRRLWAALHLTWNLEGEYGTQDPALTGFIAAFTAVVAGNCQEVRLYPRFEGPELNLQGEAEGRLVPAQLLFIGVLFALSAPVRRIWWSKLGEKIVKNGRRMAYV